MGLPPASEETEGFIGNGSPTRELSAGDRKCERSATGNNSNASIKSRSATKSLVADNSWGRLASNDKFQHTTLVVIVFNAMWIGIDTEWNHKTMGENEGWLRQAKPLAEIVENIFCVYFTGEVVIRFIAFRRKCDCYKDGWFVFDSLLVTCMVIETWVLAIITAVSGGSGGAAFLSNFSALRLLRLLRLTRMARLMRSFPELMTLVKGMMSAAKAVFWMLLALLIVMYVFAIIFTSANGDPDKEFHPDQCEYMFGSMGDSMMTLFTNGVLGDNLRQTVQAILDYGREPEIEDGELSQLNGPSKPTAYFLFWLFMCFFAIASMTLLNMLIGILCEVITQTADSEKDSMQIRDLQLCIEDAFAEIDLDADGRVSENEWAKIKTNAHVRAQMSGLGVEEVHMDERLDQIQDTIFDHGVNAKRVDGLSQEDLIAKVVEVRPDKPVSALKMEMLRAQVVNGDKDFKNRLRDIETMVCKILERRGVSPNISSGAEVVGPVSKLRGLSTQQLLDEMKNRSVAGAKPASAPGGPPPSWVPPGGISGQEAAPLA